MALGTICIAAVSGTMIMPVGNVARERHVAAGYLQQLAALRRIMQPLGRPQAALGHSLVLFTRGHADASTLVSEFRLKLPARRNCSLVVSGFFRLRWPDHFPAKPSRLANSLNG